MEIQLLEDTVYIPLVVYVFLWLALRVLWGVFTPLTSKVEWKELPKTV